MHLAGIIQRIHHLKQQGIVVTRHVSGLPSASNPFEEGRYKALEHSIEVFYQAAQALQVDSLRDLVTSATNTLLGEVAHTTAASEKVTKVEASLRRRSSWPSYHANRAKANIKCGGCLTKKEVPSVVAKTGKRMTKASSIASLPSVGRKNGKRMTKASSDIASIEVRQ